MMKDVMKRILFAALLLMIGGLVGWHLATRNLANASAKTNAANQDKQSKQEGYVHERDEQVAKTGAAPHSGPGRSTGYNFFEKAEGFKQIFRKRVLHPGAAIGYHLQKEDEVYYVLSGTGVMQMNGNEFPVKAGDAILTRPGSSHGLKQTGKDDLALIIAYEKK